MSSGLGGAPVAAHVDGDRPEAGLGDGGQLVAPRVPRFGKAVHEQHHGPVALLDQVDAGAAGVDGAVPHVGQRNSASGHGPLRRCIA